MQSCGRHICCWIVWTVLLYSSYTGNILKYVDIKYYIHTTSRYSEELYGFFLNFYNGTIVVHGSGGTDRSRVSAETYIHFSSSILIAVVHFVSVVMRLSYWSRLSVPPSCKPWGMHTSHTILWPRWMIPSNRTLSLCTAPSSLLIETCVFSPHLCLVHMELFIFSLLTLSIRIMPFIS